MCKAVKGWRIHQIHQVDEYIICTCIYMHSWICVTLCHFTVGIPLSPILQPGKGYNWNAFSSLEKMWITEWRKTGNLMLQAVFYGYRWGFSPQMFEEVLLIAEIFQSARGGKQSVYRIISGGGEGVEEDQLCFLALFFGFLCILLFSLLVASCFCSVCVCVRACVCSM